MAPKYARYLDKVVESSQTVAPQLYEALRQLTPSKPSASEAEWQTFSQTLRHFMQTQRDLGHERALNREQVERLDTYLAANRLLVACLQVAYVSDRAEIEAGLLLPP